jgi:hypothetical protein
MVIVAPLAPLTELAALTLNTDGLLETHPTVRPLSEAPLPSRGVAVNTCVCPTIIGVVGGESVTVATGTGLTVIALVPVFPSLVAETVIGPPAATAVTNPLGETVAMAPSLVDHVTSRPVTTLSPASRVTAVSC